MIIFWQIRMIFSLDFKVESNTILVDLSLTIFQNPLYLIMSAAVTLSYAFMLPIATASNTIVFRASTSTICLMVMVKAVNTMALGTVLPGNMNS